MFDAFYDMLNGKRDKRRLAYIRSFNDGVEFDLDFYLSGLSGEFNDNPNDPPQTAAGYYEYYDYSYRVPKFTIYYDYIPEDLNNKAYIEFCIKHDDMNMLTRGKLYIMQFPPHATMMNKGLSVLELVVIEARRCYDV